MKDGFHGIAKILPTVGLILFFQKSIISNYELTLTSLISLYPASRLIPPGEHYSSSQWVIVSLAAVLMLPGIKHKYRIFIMPLIPLSYLIIDFFRFIIWLIPPAEDSSPLSFTYTAPWSPFVHWAFPLILLLTALLLRFARPPLGYSNRKEIINRFKNQT